MGSNLEQLTRHTPEGAYTSILNFQITTSGHYDQLWLNGVLLYEGVIIARPSLTKAPIDLIQVTIDPDTQYQKWFFVRKGNLAFGQGKSNHTSKYSDIHGRISVIRRLIRLVSNVAYVPPAAVANALQNPTFLSKGELK